MRTDLRNFLAGIMAVVATTEYYDATEIATRILPHLVVLKVDADGDVRTRAFEATEQFVQSVKTFYTKVLHCRYAVYKVRGIY